MFDGRQRVSYLKLDVDALGNGLLTGKEDGVLGGTGQVRHAKLRCFGARGIEQFGENAIDLYGFLFGVVDYLTSDASFRKIAADDVEHAGDASQRVADFVRQSSCQLAQCGEVLGA